MSAIADVARTLERDLATARERIAALEAERDAAINDNDEKERLLVEAGYRVAALKTELDDSNGRDDVAIEAFRAEIDHLRKQVAALEAERDNRSREADATAKLDAARARIAELETAAQSVVAWHDRDGSVGGCSHAVETLKAALGMEAKP